MNWSELLDITNLDKIEVELIVPVRKPLCEGDTSYMKGEFQGFKAGSMGGGHSNYKNGSPQSFDSRNMRWLKKPEVLVAYNVSIYGKKQQTDWVDFDNCVFKIRNDD